MANSASRLPYTHFLWLAAVCNSQKFWSSIGVLFVLHINLVASTMKLFFLSTLALLLVTVSARVGGGSAGGGGQERHLELSQIQHRKLRRAAENQAIEGQFIFVVSDLVEDVLEFAFGWIRGSDAKLEYEFDTVVKGFTVSGLLADLLLAILEDDMVEYVQEVSILLVVTFF